MQLRKLTINVWRIFNNGKHVGQVKKCRCLGMLFRYELGLNGESIGVGILMGISELDGLDDDQLENLTKDFDECLPIPSNNVYVVEKSKSYFTQNGINTFKNSIEKLNTIYISQGFDILESNISMPYQDVLYQDEFQVVLKVA